jgi:GNAT superfamily N-acetyltransferase
MTGPSVQIEFRAARIDEGNGLMLVTAMADEMRVLYEGLDITDVAMPKAGPAELGPPDGAFLVGYGPDGTPQCGGGIKLLPDGACEIKRMYVVPAARRHGVARLLLAALEDTARDLGYTVARLDTGPRQHSARRMYEAAGYREIGNFNANPVATYFGEKPL